MRFRSILFWIVVVLVTISLQYFYNPSIPVMLIGGFEMLVLSVLLSWSANRVGGGMRGGILLTVLSLVAGLMFNQGLDVAYSLLAAPEGLRFNMAIEIALSTLVFLLFGLLARVLLSRPQVEK